MSESAWRGFSVSQSGAGWWHIRGAGSCEWARYRRGHHRRMMTWIGTRSRRPAQTSGVNCAPSAAAGTNAQWRKLGEGCALPAYAAGSVSRRLPATPRASGCRNTPPLGMLPPVVSSNWTSPAAVGDFRVGYGATMENHFIAGVNGEALRCERTCLLAAADESPAPSAAGMGHRNPRQLSCWIDTNARLMSVA